jgi:hypothetical protein
MYNFDNNRLCIDMDTNLFFDKYEENKEVSNAVDSLCSQCPMQRKCLAYGVSNQEWGVWGGVYLELGKISKENNSHKDNDAWFKIWSNATMDKNV